MMRDGDSWTHVGVDSGKLLLVDPCYLTPFLNEKGREWLDRSEKLADGGDNRSRIVVDVSIGDRRQIGALLHVGDDGNYLVEATADEIKIEYAD